MNSSRALATLGEADLAPLEVSADLSLSIDGQEITVDSYTDRIVVDVPTVGVAMALLRRARETIPGVARVLAAVDLTALVRVSRSTVAVLGADARSGPLSKRLEAPIAVSFGGVLAALAQELL